MAIPFVNIALRHRLLTPELLEATRRVFEHGQFILGPEVAAFEERFATLAGTRFAVGVDNGTSSLILLLRSLGIGQGDEVITAANSFIASASCAALLGARPILIDVDETYTMDPTILEKAISPRTKAIIAVHLTGHPANMERINAIAQYHKIPVIEDAAQAVGASYKGKPVGSLAHAASFSLHPLKNLSACGDAGIITTDDETLHYWLLLARNHGLRDRDHAAFWSTNNRLDTLQAALLLVKMDYLQEWTAQRRRIAAFYRAQLTGLVECPIERPDCTHVYHTFIIQTDRRDALKAFLEHRAIGTAVHYQIPIPFQEAAAKLGYRPGQFPVAERQAGRMLSLPIYPELTGEQQRDIVSAIQEFYRA